MSKGLLGVEDALLYLTYPTTDGRWMVFAPVDGKPRFEAGFLGSEEDAEIIAKVMTERDRARQANELDAKVGDLLKPPTFKEIADKHGIPWQDE